MAELGEEAREAMLFEILRRWLRMTENIKITKHKNNKIRK